MSWHNYFAGFAFKQFYMNREEENKNSIADQERQQTNADEASASRHEDDAKHSYPGKLDQVEGQMENGEIGGGIKKESEENGASR
jgi:hypothetical protein